VRGRDDGLEVASEEASSAEAGRPVSESLMVPTLFDFTIASMARSEMTPQSWLSAASNIETRQLVWPQSWPCCCRPPRPGSPPRWFSAGFPCRPSYSSPSWISRTASAATGGRPPGSPGGLARLSSRPVRRAARGAGPSRPAATRAEPVSAAKLSRLSLTSVSRRADQHRRTPAAAPRSLLYFDHPVVPGPTSSGTVRAAANIDTTTSDSPRSAEYAASPASAPDPRLRTSRLSCQPPA